MGVCVLVGGLCAAPGCKRAAHLADYDLPSVEVKAVTHYGLTLDKDATAREVAGAALLAMRDDLLAKDAAARKTAMNAQFELSAANEIRSRNGTGLSDDEFLYEAVRRWAPTVSYYVRDLPESWDEAEPRLYELDGTSADKRIVMIELADPTGDPNATVVLGLSMAKDEGFWRVLQLGFDRNHRTIPPDLPLIDASEASGGNG